MWTIGFVAAIIGHRKKPDRTGIKIIGEDEYAARAEIPDVRLVGGSCCRSR
jgi:hypothetical protein